MFVDDPERGELRIFTPAVELPLAGHPLVGTAWLLPRARRGAAALRPPAGEVPVRFDGELDLRRRPTRSGRRRSSSSSSARRRRSRRSTGPPDGYGAVGVWAWIDEAAGIVRERVFVPDAGIAEDEATGSAAMRLSARLGRAIEIRQGAARGSSPGPSATGWSRSAAGWS